MNSTVPKITAVHLLNDFSGSPKVFRQALEELRDHGYEINLFCNRGKGFLSSLDGISSKHIPYRRSENKVITLCSFLISQIYLFWTLLLKGRSNEVLYINTLLPFGAALGGWIKGMKVIYHVHEVSLRPKALKALLMAVNKRTASRSIMVSEFLGNACNLPQNRWVRIYNSLDWEFLDQAENHKPQVADQRKIVLMICSLRVYKGVIEFTSLARRLPKFDFELVVNADERQIEEFFAGMEIPENLRLFPAQENVHPFYQRASLVLNLSLPNQWVETFGLTALEAMAYGLPVIVPPAGGIAELVGHAQQGFHVNPEAEEELVARIRRILGDELVWNHFSQAAQKRAEAFAPGSFRRELINEFERTIAHPSCPVLVSRSHSGISNG